MQKFILIALLGATACAQQTPEELATIRAEAAQNDAQTLEATYKPALAACLTFATTGAVDQNALTQAGFAAPRQVFGRTGYDKAPAQVVVSDRAGTCRASWIAPSASGIATSAIKNLMASRGFTPSGQAKRETLFSNGTSTVGVTSKFSFSSVMSSLDTTFSRKAP